MDRDIDESVMIFSVENMKNHLKTCAGVIEFTAPEGTVIVPGWVILTLNNLV